MSGILLFGQPIVTTVFQRRWRRRSFVQRLECEHAKVAVRHGPCSYGYCSVTQGLHAFACQEAQLDSTLLRSESHDGTLAKTDFVADLTGTHIVSLAFAPANVEQEECLVGDSLFRTDCQHLGSGLDLDWSVTRLGSGGDRILIDNQTYYPHAFGGAGAVQTELGRFDAELGGHYKISLRMRQSSPILRADSPRLIVEPHWKYFEPLVIQDQISSWFAAIVGVVGAVILFRAIT